MTVVITGATGHIGANLVRTMVEKKRSVRCLVHVGAGAFNGLDVELVRGDVCDVESLYHAFRGADVVYHLAAYISLSNDDWPKVEKINVGGTRNVVEACLHTGVRRLVHFSSIHALTQEPFETPVDETRTLVDSIKYPPYDRSKAVAEKEIRRGIERGLDAVIVSPTAVIGPHDYEPSFLGEAILSMARNKLPAMVTGGFDWVDVRDVVDGAIQAEFLAPTGAAYLLSGQWASMCDMAALIAEITGVKNNKFVCPLWLARLGSPVIKSMSRVTGKRPLYTSVSLRALNSNRCISHEKAARELGYAPRAFRETLEDTLRWFADTGQLAELPGKNTKVSA